MIIFGFVVVTLIFSQHHFLLYQKNLVGQCHSFNIDVLAVAHIGITRYFRQTQILFLDKVVDFLCIYKTP